MNIEKKCWYYIVFISCCISFFVTESSVVSASASITGHDNDVRVLSIDQNYSMDDEIGSKNRGLLENDAENEVSSFEKTINNFEKKAINLFSGNPVDLILNHSSRDDLLMDSSGRLAYLNASMLESDVDMHIYFTDKEKIDDDIFNYSVEYFRSIGLGLDTTNKGLLFVGVIDGTSLNFQVLTGYGLEGDLPDGKIGRILDDKASILNEKSLIEYVYSVAYELCGEIEGVSCSETSGTNYFSGIGNGSTGGGGASRVFNNVFKLPDVKPPEEVKPPEDVCNACNRITLLEERFNAFEIKVENTFLVFPNLFEKYLGAWAGYESSGSIGGADSPIVKVLKGQTTRIVNELKNPTWLSTITSHLGAWGGYESSASVGGLDSPIVKVLKGQTTRIVNELKNPTWLSTITSHLGAWVGYESSKSVGGLDSPIVKVLKGQTTRIVDALSGIGGGGGGTGIDTKVFDDMLKAINALSDKSTKLTNEIVSAIEKLAIEVVEEAGTNFWDALLGGAGKLLDFLEFIIEKVIYLIVPEDSKFISDAITNLSDSFQGKFEPIKMIETELEGSLLTEEKAFENIDIVLPVYGQVKFLDVEFLNQAVSVFRGFVSGVMMIFTGGWAIRKINSGLIK